MLAAVARLVKDAGSELVLGLVAPVGAHLDSFVEVLEDCLRAYRYRQRVVRVSDLFRALSEPTVAAPTSEYERISRHMDLGNQLRTRSGAAEVLAVWAMSDINAIRREEASGGRLPSTAWTIRSIKHPDEVRALRAVYGQGFFLIGLAVPEQVRRAYLRRKGLTDVEIDALIRRDRSESDAHGQHMREAFELADVFIPHGGTNSAQPEVERFLRLVFGKPVEPPTRDEQAMFLAYAASTRSADLSRQVGAVLWKERLGVVATGCNDVPQPGGGLYDERGTDQRDYVRGGDANEIQKEHIATEVATQVCAALKARGVEAPHDAVATACRTTALFDITEFGRAVHAEMDVILAAGRAGTSTLDATLYCTTFPCHNCTKHIVASGIARVVYVEPYPKSQAEQLHGDAISLGGVGGDAGSPDGRVRYEPFVGVGPRRYLDLFSMRVGDGYALRRKASTGLSSWDEGDACVRVSMPPTSYLDREQQFAKMSEDLLTKEPPQ